MGTKMTHPSPDIKIKITDAHKDGTSISQLVNIFGYHRNSIRRWIKSAKKDPTFETPRKTGSGRPSAFSGKSGKKLLRIISKPASKFGFETDFWTTLRIQKVCKDELGVKISKMAIFRALKRFEHSYKKPKKRYYEASQQKQDKWVKEVLPRINLILKNQRAILYFEDE